MFSNLLKTVGKRARRRISERIRLTLETLEKRTLLSGTWSALNQGAPASIGTMELLSDGTVMAQGDGVSNAWYKLTPDSTGSYVNGTWSTLASMNLQRLYTATNVLTDGRVFELGGEYSGPNGQSNWTNTGEIYDPVANTWTSIPNFPQSQFGDDPSILLPDGRVIAGYLSGAQTYIYDPTANSWSTGPTKLNSDRSDEETWIKLPDGSILSYNIFGNAQHAQRLDTTTMTWVDAGSVPVALSSSSVGSELGPGLLLPDGRVFLIGATGHTAFYTPSTNSWAAGPDIPNGDGADDAPGAMLPNGNVLFAADTPLFKSPTHIYEFDPVANTYTNVTPSNPDLSGSPSYVLRMLMLPSGQVLFTDGSSQLYVYTPSGTPQSAWKPTISSVVPSGNNYTLTGTQLNGLSQGASYGDDAEMDTNYPIIELVNGAGTVYFARTSNWSSTGVATGSTSVTTDFSLPAGLPNASYSLYVIANGIASDPFTFSTISGLSADMVVTDSGPSSVDVSAGATTATYTIKLTNNGPDAAANVVLSDTLPAGSTFVSMTADSGNPDSFTFGQSGNVITESAKASISSGNSDTFTLLVSVPNNLNNGDDFSNTASVSATTTDPNSGNNSAKAAGSIVNHNELANLVIANSGPTTSTEGNNVTYTIKVTNNGPTNAKAVVLTDTLGANLKFVSATTGQGSFKQSGSVVTFSFGVVGLNQTVTATVTAQSTEDGSLTNTASVASSTNNTNNNSQVATTAVAEAQIVVTNNTVSGKKVNNQTVATFTHAGGVEPASAFKATINWGDNTSSTGTVSLSGTTYSVKGSHTYRTGGTHSVSTTVVEIASNPPQSPTTSSDSATTVPTNPLTNLDAFFALLRKREEDPFLGFGFDVNAN